MKRRRQPGIRLRSAFACLLFAAIVWGAPGGGAEGQTDETKILHRGAQRGAPVTPHVYDGDVRDLPRPPTWQPGDPIRVVPQRFYRPPGTPASPVVPVSHADPLVERQRRQPTPPPSGSTQFTLPTRNFDGQGFTGSVPPDTVGDVGPNHYIQAVNARIQNKPLTSSAQIRIYDKQQPVPNALATFKMDSLSGGACAGLSDPIVLYDRQADRWLLAEMSFTYNSLCIYLSQTGDPVSGGWYSYEFVTPGLPDYPKLGVWATDANIGGGSYIAVTNEGDPSAVYAFNRGQMLIGAAASFQRFTIPRLASFGIPTPADPDGPAAPPNGAAAIVMRQRDTELNEGPVAPGDLLEIWLLDVDWIDPGNSTLSAPPPIDVEEFNSDLCELVSPCFEQPEGAPRLEPLNWFLMHRLQYMNHGTHESLTGNFTVDADGLDRGGIRWFELRRIGAGNWTLHQEGTYSIDSANRWVGTIAGDRTGNIALGFNVVSKSMFPSLRYTGRRSFDSPGVMTQAETTGAAGTHVEDTTRYGDYAAISLDPVDDCTFWLAGEYSISGLWQTRVATFSFENCPCNVPPGAPEPVLGVVVDNRIDVSWNDSGSASAEEYLVQRSRTAGGPYLAIATIADSSPGVSGGPGYQFQDTGVSGGITYYYVITALDSESCPSEDPSEAGATATGPCVLPPSFAGVQLATSDTTTCAIEVSWSAAVAACGGPVVYDVYRSTTRGFVPGPGNLLVTDLTGTAALDANGLFEGIEYFYVVRARDLSNGLDDGNSIYRSRTATGIIPGGAQTLFSEDFEAPDALIDWTVGTGPGAHSCGAWERLDDPAYLPNGGSGFYARALSEGCPATSTFLDSPVIDLSGPEVQSATLWSDLRFTVLFERATVEAWDGSAWQVVSPNFSSVNGFFFFDVTPQAVGNPLFQIRFNYQDATDDDFYSVDDVSIQAELQFGSECATSSGVSPVPDGSAATVPLTARRLDDAGSEIRVDFDATSCPAPDYNLLHGSLEHVAASTIDGSVCGVDAGGFVWDPAPAGSLYFLIVGFDGIESESSWGLTSIGERNGLAASGTCGAGFKNIQQSCP